MRSGIMSFSSYHAFVGGDRDAAYDAYCDHLEDMRSEGEPIYKEPGVKVDWAAIQREIDEERRAAVAYIRVLDPYCFWGCGFRVNETSMSRKAES